MKKKYKIGSALILITVIFMVLFFYTRPTEKNETNKIENTTSGTQNNESTTGSEPKPEEQSNEDESDYDDHNHDHDSGINTPDELTIYDATDNVQKLTGYNISPPQIVENAYSTTLFSQIVLAHDNYVIVLDENNKLNIFNPLKKEMTTLANNVTQATSSDDGKDVIFEVKGTDEYSTYQYQAKEDSPGIQHFLSTTSSITSLGKIDDFIYFSNMENEDKTFYTPAPTYEEAATSLFFNSTTYFDSIKAFKQNNQYIAYSSKEHKLYKGTFGGENSPLLDLPSNDDKNLVVFEPNPFNTASTQYIIAFSYSKSLPSGSTVFIDNVKNIDVNEITKARWISKDTFVYSDSSFSDRLLIYNVSTKKKYLLANDISSFEYDYETNSIYFNVINDDIIRKIVIN